MNLTFKLKKHEGEEPRSLDICAVNKCKQSTEVIFLDIPLCDYHWQKHCEEVEETKDGNQPKPTATLEELYPRFIPLALNIPILQIDPTPLSSPNQLLSNIPSSSSTESISTECIQLQFKDNNKPLSPSLDNQKV